MTDLSKTIAPKSDQLNSDDLIVGPKTIKVTKVSLLAEADQPIGINFDGDNNKPYKPCKSMRRVLVNTWGSDGAAYVGRMMTIYREPTVKFGGQDVGGIRISHMSNIDGPKTMALTAAKASRKPYTVQPLAVSEAAQIIDRTSDAEAAAAKGTAALKAFWSKLPKAQQEPLVARMPDFKKTAQAADVATVGEELSI